MKAILLVLLSSGLAFAQVAITPEQRQNANSLFQSGDWVSTAQAYQTIAHAEPQNWNARMRWGIALVHLNRKQEAIALLKEADQLGNNPQTKYNLASCYAKYNEGDAAFEWLSRSIQAGYTAVSSLENDPHFSGLKTDARFSKSVDLINRNIFPCRYSPESRQFDFWVGEWDVRNPQGQQAGHSKIDLILGDCIIFENWTSAPPNLYAGKSFNLFNSTTHKWMQTWVDDKGGVIEFIDGEYKDNKLTFLTRPDTANQITRLTFFNQNENLVRQLFEVTHDGGKTWTTTTDLFYHRVK